MAEAMFTLETSLMEPDLERADMNIMEVFIQVTLREVSIMDTVSTTTLIRAGPTRDNSWITAPQEKV